MKTRGSRKGGFTIVELLIVIVVIAILAAISIVVYTGIQTRAENTKTIQAVSHYVKALKAYAVVNDDYPVASFPCLGPLGTTCGKVAGAAGTCATSGGGSSQAGFDTAMKTILNGEVPAPSAQRISCTGDVQAAGALYRSTTGASGSIWYFLNGDQPCEGIGGVTYGGKILDGQATRCLINF